mmetsp:Transcript_32368/g.92878  ORF Transcript_32368/g.92878 Transcript_32368/m.92878 type:complete len:235 (-) Transcript_32368:74-778(-)
MGIEDSFTASWKAVMPLLSSWKTRERIGGGTERTPVLMLWTKSCWIHWNTNSTRELDAFRASRVSSLIPLRSITSSFIALVSASSLALQSSISAKARACSMLNIRAMMWTKPCFVFSSAVECFMKATMLLQASNHLARRLWVELQPSQKRAYAIVVRKTTRNPTRKVKPLQMADCLRISPSSSSPGTMLQWPCFRDQPKKPVRMAQGMATVKAKGKTLPRTRNMLRRMYFPLFE